MRSSFAAVVLVVVLSLLAAPLTSGFALSSSKPPAPPTQSSVPEETTFQQQQEQQQQSQPQSSSNDILRDLDGNPLSTEYFEQAMGLPIVDGYTCPSEDDAFRGLMSNGCRVHLLPGGETAFYKRIVFENLDHARTKLQSAPFKLKRDIKSYQVVGSFLSSQACQRLTETTGVHIPKCYEAQMEPDYDNPMQSKFSFLLQDLAPWDGWYQRWLLHDRTEVQATLTTYAKIHAFFWQGSDFWRTEPEAAREFEGAVWKSGSYVQPTQQNDNQCRMVAKEWAVKKLRFEPDLASFDYWDNLGERLQSVAPECGRLAHPFANDDDDAELSQHYQQYRTFTHGDPKQANLFFRPTTTATESGPEQQLQVGLIDFQWAGFGLAATDIAHFLTSSVHADRLVDGGEEELQRYYFDQLQTYLVEYGACRTAEEALEQYSFDTFIQQYETAVLDLVRLIVAYTWNRFTEHVDKDDEAGCARTMNKTSYNKSIPNIIWLMSRCDEILKSRGV